MCLDLLKVITLSCTEHRVLGALIRHVVGKWFLGTGSVLTVETPGLIRSSFSCLSTSTQFYATEENMNSYV